jgi:predicted enzyme related to lactoylglutathione lyase
MAHRRHVPPQVAKLGLTVAQASALRELTGGARILEDRRNLTPGGWVILTDPENNEFCLEQGN